MMNNLGKFMQQVAEAMGAKFAESGDNVYSITIPLDDSRSQEVYGLLVEGHPAADGEQVVLFMSAVGNLDPRINLSDLLRENYGPIYSKVCLYGEDAIMVAASTILESADVNEVVVMIEEIASFADYLEDKYFGVDLN